MFLLLFLFLWSDVWQTQPEGIAVHLGSQFRGHSLSCLRKALLHWEFVAWLVHIFLDQEAESLDWRWNWVTIIKVLPPVTHLYKLCLLPERFYNLPSQHHQLVTQACKYMNLVESFHIQIMTINYVMWVEPSCLLVGNFQPCALARGYWRPIAHNLLSKVIFWLVVYVGSLIICGPLNSLKA